MKITRKIIVSILIVMMVIMEIFCNTVNAKIETQYEANLIRNNLDQGFYASDDDINQAKEDLDEWNKRKSANSSSASSTKKLDKELIDSLLDGKTSYNSKEETYTYHTLNGEDQVFKGDIYVLFEDESLDDVVDIFCSIDVSELSNEKIKKKITFINGKTKSFEKTETEWFLLMGEWLIASVGQYDLKAQYRH